LQVCTACCWRLPGVAPSFNLDTSEKWDDRIAGWISHRPIRRTALSCGTVAQTQSTISDLLLPISAQYPSHFVE
jgi:hypothetical protein